MLLWIAAGYQLFDGLNLGSGFSLRGAGDVRVPALLFFALSWGVFVPLAHALSFEPGAGLGRFPAAVRLRRRRRMDRVAGLRRAARERAVRAVAIGAWQKIRL